MPHQLNATGFLQKVKSFSPAIIKWEWSGANVGEWSEGMEEKVCIGLNCEPCMCWEGWGGEGRRRGREESGKGRKEKGNCELHLSLSRVSLNKSYTSVVYQEGWSDWLTNHMPIALRNNVLTMHTTHYTWGRYTCNWPAQHMCLKGGGGRESMNGGANCSQLQILYEFATAAQTLLSLHGNLSSLCRRG